MSHQTKPVTFVLIARIPAEGIQNFRAYEDAVLPLLPEFNGCLERRLRSPDDTMEMHIISFASNADLSKLSKRSPAHGASLAVGKIICEAGIASDGERLVALTQGSRGSSA
jgi:hypothetical protein